MPRTKKNPPSAALSWPNAASIDRMSVGMSKPDQPMRRNVRQPRIAAAGGRFQFVGIDECYRRAGMTPRGSAPPAGIMGPDGRPPVAPIGDRAVPLRGEVT